jgi:hypothetical protein
VVVDVTSLPSKSFEVREFSLRFASVHLAAALAAKLVYVANEQILGQGAILTKADPRMIDGSWPRYIRLCVSIMISIAVREFNVVFDEGLLTILRMTIPMATNSLRTTFLHG